MVCILCSADTQVINSRPQKRLNQVWRRRKCIGCSFVFSTHEVAQYDAIWTVSNGKNGIALFSRDKLLMSIYKSCQHRDTALTDASGLVGTIISKLHQSAHSSVIDARTIVQTAEIALNRFDNAASVHYRAFHRK
jgi:transcriptional repressor NrdR